MPGVRTTHHVKIGANYFLIRPGTYLKRQAPIFGARFSTGDPDYNTLNAWQYWAQSCWVGGQGAEDWTDDAMYDEGVGVDSTQHEVMVLSRDMAYPTGGSGTLNGEASNRRFITFNGTLYCLSYGVIGTLASKLWKWDVVGPPAYRWLSVHTFMNATRSAAVFNTRLYIGDYGTDINYMTTGATWVAVAKPAAVGSVTPYAMLEYRGKLYCGFGNKIWRLNADNTWDGSTVFYDALGVDYITNMEVHLGFLYMVSQNGHVLRTDGNNTFDLWQFPDGVRVTSIRSFDGKLFVACNEGLDGTTSQQAVLYQFSGAAVTELKRWGIAGQDITIGQLRVVGHRLFFGAGGLFGIGGGFGIGAYDPREDGYHMWSSNRDSVTYPGGTSGIDWSVDDVMFYGGYVFASVRKYGIFDTKFSFKDVTRYQATYDTTAAGVTPGSGNGGWYKSSDFDGGTPGLLKLWNAITVHVDLPHSSCSAFIEYSVDGGQTWVVAGTATKTGAAVRYATTFTLGSVATGALYATRFKYRITLRTTNSGFSPQLRTVIVRYLPIPEPNWEWNMTLVLSDTQELLDGTIENPDNEAKLAALHTAFRSQNLVTFTEPGGTQYAAGSTPGVMIMSMDERIPMIDASSKGALEREIHIRLMEMVDQYES